jgi:protoporphyrin/coproporphyrin ferrochelatase
MSKNHFRHDQPDRTGILMVNLGTPDAPDRASVRRYLKEFLWDPRVVEGSRIAWWLVLNLVILNTRPSRSAAAYRKIWTAQGSPLMDISRRQQEALQARLEERHGDALHVALAMRYGKPSIRDGLERLRDAGARRVLVLPMYPQYSATTTASIFDEITHQLRGWRWLPELRFVNHYHDEPAYITALAESIDAWRAAHGEAEHLLLSFHGIPQEYFDKGDPYYCECQKTGRLLAEALGLQTERWTLSFQSRLGPRQWLQPYTDKTLEGLAQRGIKSVQVVCPGFSADCLETLEEIAVTNRDRFLAAGGKEFGYIPALNDGAAHLNMLADLALRHVGGWPEAQEGVDATSVSDRLAQRSAHTGAQGPKE